jgi:hypothetical protein
VIAYDVAILRLALSLLLAVLLINPSQVGAGTLAVSFDTEPAGGRFAPRNVVAVWVETVTGRFVKTIGRWSAERTPHLIAWAMASGTDADAVSGATRANHTETLEVIWDTADQSGELVVAGTYRIRMELADDNSGFPEQNNQGTFSFSIDGVARVETPADNGGFSSVVIDYSGGPVGERDPSDPDPSDPDPSDPDPSDPDPDPPGVEGGCGGGGGAGPGALLLVLVALFRAGGRTRRRRA